MITRIVSEKIRILTTISMFGVIFIHAKFILSRWRQDTLHPNSFNYSDTIQYFLSEELFRLCVPLFFFVSGFIHFSNRKNKHSSFIRIIKKKFNSIITPYTIWALISSLIYLVVSDSFSVDETFWLKALINPIPYQFWFLQILIICFVLSPLINRLFLNRENLLLGIIILLFFIDLNSLRSNWHGVLFFLLGALTTTKREYFKYYNDNILYLYLILILINTIFFSLNNNFLIRVLIHKASIIVGLLYIISFLLDEKTPVKNRFLLNLLNLKKGYPFFLYAFHEPTLSFLKNVWIRNVHLNIEILGYFILPIVIIILSFYIYNILEYFFPVALKVLTGYRS